MSIINAFIWDIITRSISGELTQEEKVFLEQWLNENENNRKSYELFSGLKFSVKTSGDGNYKEEIFNNITRKILFKQKATQNIRILLAAAATFLLLITTAVLFYYLGERKVNSQWVDIYTPKGVKSRIVLPDGSSVSLNSGSKFSYPSYFTGPTRDVMLDGEAFFDVSKDISHPFIVKTATVNVCVLGTRFNLKSYKNDYLVETTLEKGSVKVMGTIGTNYKEILLDPGKQAVLDTRTNVFLVSKVKPELFSAWQTGKYYFKSKSFDEIAHVLERAFNVSIDIRSERLKREIFSGDFVRGENIEQILSIIKKNTGIKYSIAGQQITITEK